MPYDINPNYYYQPWSSPPPEPVKPVSADYPWSYGQSGTSNTSGAPTPLERLSAEPTTTDLLADRQPSSDHTYTISTRSFAPPESFGAGFQGDNRGYTTDWNATSRIHSTVTIDADDQVAIGADDVSASSDPSIHHAIPFYSPTETPDIHVLSQDVEHSGEVSTINFETRHSGEDAVLHIPLINRNPSPTLDVNTDLQIVSDREANTLVITGEITGDNFPATEVFINDNDGNAVFLATGKPPGVATPAANATAAAPNTTVAAAAPAVEPAVEPATPPPEEPAATDTAAADADTGLLPATVTAAASTNDVAELNTTQLTAPDGFIYDFKLSDVDYIQPLAPLPHENLTVLPEVPADAAAVYASATPSDNPLMTWRLDILQHNKELWDASANRKIKDGVTTLLEQVLCAPTPRTPSSGVLL